ncbi:MAG: HEAT repeat domain-containing protein [Gloeomargaritaceae cyanobacterium C42_A2020_066]|nr:HEAT repeat domain-containing protein [Gloeomargaritaceae cyanobacterium C42_A2020_066]
MDDELFSLNGQGTWINPLDQPPEPEPEQPDPDLMLALLEDSDVLKRMQAARAFCELQDGRAGLRLIPLLQDACPLVRVSAAYALGRNPTPEAIDPLIQQLDEDWNGYVRKGLVWALGNCRDSRVLPSLITALQTDIAAVRLWAASALTQTEHLDAEARVGVSTALQKTLEMDPVPAIRSNCAWALGQLGLDLPMGDAYHQLITALMAALEDADMGVREDARAALVKLGHPKGLQRIEELEQEGWL